MEEEIKPKRHYKIELGDTIRIKRTDFNGYTFYKVALPKKRANGNVEYFDKTITFPQGTDLPDGTLIIIKDFYEDVYLGRVDKFNPIWTLRILDYEVTDKEPINSELAIKDYLNKVDNNGIDLGSVVDDITI